VAGELINTLVFWKFYDLENGIKYGPYRVWVKHDSYPGLAMSRSLGDLCATSVGVTPDPGNFRK